MNTGIHLWQVLTIHMLGLLFLGDGIKNIELFKHHVLDGCLVRTPPPRTFSVPRDVAGKKKKQNKTIKIRGSATKGFVSTRHANFTMKKKFTRGDITLNPCTPNSLSQEVLPHKNSFLEDPPEVTGIRCPGASCSSLSDLVPLSSSLGLVSARIQTSWIFMR